MSEIKKDGWIPIEESVPETGKYIMVSFENFTLPDIANMKRMSREMEHFIRGTRINHILNMDW